MSCFIFYFNETIVMQTCNHDFNIFLDFVFISYDCYNYLLSIY